jgi:hypothetical protein
VFEATVRIICSCKTSLRGDRGDELFQLGDVTLAILSGRFALVFRLPNERLVMLHRALVALLRGLEAAILGGSEKAKDEHDRGDQTGADPENDAEWDIHNGYLRRFSLRASSPAAVIPPALAPMAGSIRFAADAGGP